MVISSSWGPKCSASLNYFSSVEKKKFEADIETHFLRISQKYRHCIEEISSKLGFLRINMKKNGCHKMTFENNLKPFRSVRMNKELENLTLTEEGYVLTFEVKNQ